jgi:hypothetical protein
MFIPFVTFATRRVVTGHPLTFWNQQQEGGVVNNYHTNVVHEIKDADTFGLHKKAHFCFSRQDYLRVHSTDDVTYTSSIFGAAPLISLIY